MSRSWREIRCWRKLRSWRDEEPVRSRTTPNILGQIFQKIVSKNSL